MRRFGQSAHVRVRTLFLSDIHLGFRRARARDLADFLATIDADTIVLVGDILDSLSLAQRFFWPTPHSRVVHALLDKQRAGARILYIPGNHDTDRAAFAAMMMGKIEIHREWVHHTVRGERLLVVHGDQFDRQREASRWVHRLAESVYDLSVVLNDYLNDLGAIARLGYWPLAERLKLAVGGGARFIALFEETAIAYARTRGYDGIICGHIHRACLRRAGNATYGNAGDWVETCSALIEETDGQLRLWRLADAQPQRARASGALLGEAA